MFCCDVHDVLLLLLNVEPWLTLVVSISFFLTFLHAIDFLGTPHATKSESMDVNYGNKKWQLETFERTNYYHPRMR